MGLEDILNGFNSFYNILSFVIGSPEERYSLNQYNMAVEAQNLEDTLCSNIDKTKQYISKIITKEDNKELFIKKIFCHSAFNPYTIGNINNTPLYFIPREDSKEEVWTKTYCQRYIWLFQRLYDILDVVLLENNIDIYQIQKTMGIYVRYERDIKSLQDIYPIKLLNLYLDNIDESKTIKIPEVLNTNKAQALLSRAVEAGYITVEAGQYKWNGEKVLLAYFAIKATTYLGLKKKFKANACWKPFELLFSVTNLKGAKADCEKYYSDFHPAGYDGIDTLFEANIEGQK